MKLKSRILYSLTSLLIAYNAYAMEESKDCEKKHRPVGVVFDREVLKREVGMHLNGNEAAFYHLMNIAKKHGLLAFRDMGVQDFLECNSTCPHDKMASFLAALSAPAVAPASAAASAAPYPQPMPASAAPQVAVDVAPHRGGAGIAVGGGFAEMPNALEQNIKAVAGRLINSPTEVDKFIDIADRYGVILQEGQDGTIRELMTSFGMTAADFLTTMEVSARNFAEKTMALPLSQQISLLTALQEAAVTARLANFGDFTPTAQDVLDLAGQVKVGLLVNPVETSEALSRISLFSELSPGSSLLPENIAKILQYATADQRGELSRELGAVLTIPETPELVLLRERIARIWSLPRGYEILINAFNTMLPPAVTTLLAGTPLKFSHLWALLGCTNPTQLFAVLTQLEAELAAQPAPVPAAAPAPAPALLGDPVERAGLRAEQDARFAAAQAADQAREEAAARAVPVESASAGGSGHGVGVAAAADEVVEDDYADPVLVAASKMSNDRLNKVMFELSKIVEITRHADRVAVLDAVENEEHKSFIARLLNPASETAESILVAFSIAKQADGLASLNFVGILMIGLMERKDDPSKVLQWCYKVAHDASSFAR